MKSIKYFDKKNLTYYFVQCKPGHKYVVIVVHELLLYNATKIDQSYEESYNPGTERNICGCFVLLKSLNDYKKVIFQQLCTKNIGFLGQNTYIYP